MSVAKLKKLEAAITKAEELFELNYTAESKVGLVRLRGIENAGNFKIVSETVWIALKSMTIGAGGVILNELNASEKLQRVENCLLCFPIADGVEVVENALAIIKGET